MSHKINKRGDFKLIRMLSVYLSLDKKKSRWMSSKWAIFFSPMVEYNLCVCVCVSKNVIWIRQHSSSTFT